MPLPILSILSAGGLMPHGYCYLWRQDILALHVISDAVIGLSYFSIPLALLVIIKRRGDLNNVQNLFFLFMAFIVCCGCTHLFQIYTIWEPAYVFSGWLKALTGAVSLITAIVLWPLIHKIVAIPSAAMLHKKNEELELQIAERIKAEKKLHAHQEQLEEIIQARTQELTELNHKLIKSNKNLEQFAYITSHDLQEPLRTLMNYMNEIQEEYQQEFKDPIATYFRFAMQSAHRMHSLINDLLAFSQIDQRKQQFVSTPLESPLNNALANIKHSPTFKDIPLEFTCGTLPEVTGDSSLLEQLFHNLITNSLKYRREEPVKISIDSQEEENMHVICVKDNGIGFDMEYKEKVFEVFQRLHPKHQYEGTGIGLAICHRIVEHHSGIIWVDSVEGQGSAFYFSLPKANQTSQMQS